MKDSFVFYRSFYEAINDLDDKDQLKVYKAICEMSLNFNEIELSGISSTIFKLIKPQIEANIKRFENGKKGGAPKNNQNAIKKQPKNNQDLTDNQPRINQKTTKKQPNVNVNDNVNVNVNDNSSSKENNIIDYYNQNISGVTPIILEQLQYYLKDIDGESKIRLAINKAVESNIRTFSYIKAILKCWYGKNWSEVLEEQKSFENKNVVNSPEWLNQNIQKEEVSKKEKKELDELLKEFKEK